MEPKQQTTSAEVDDLGENAGATEQGGTHATESGKHGGL